MAIRKEIKTIFALDGERKYTDAVKEINKQQRLLNAEMKDSAAKYDLAGDAQGKLQAKTELLTKKIENQEQKVKEARAAMEYATKKYGENSDAATDLKIQYHSAEAELSKLKATLIKTNTELATQRSKLKAVGDQAQVVGDKMQRMGSKLSSVGSTLSMTVTAPLVAAAGYAAKAAMDYESAFAGVEKTVDATTEQLAEMKDGILEMSTEIPAAATDIAAVAESAGQLGIQTDNILGFTEVMINLGVATNMTATEGASQLAKFANIMQMSQEDFDRLGSVIVDLGNNTATTEADIVSMGMRLAGAGKQVGMTEAEIMGLAASMSSVGVEAEAGGSAMSKVMVNMQLAVLNGGESLKSFASVAGMSSDEFKTAFETNAMGAISAFITGLGSMEDKGGSAIATLDEMGITEVRMRDALLRSAGAGDTLTKAIDLSNTAWEENNALTEEAAKKAATNESQMIVSKNRIDAAAISIGEQLLPVIADLVEDVAGAAKAFADMDPEMQKTVIIALGVAAAMGPVAKTVGVVTQTVGSATSAIGKFISKLAEKRAAEAAATAATKGMSMATGGLAAAINPATLVMVGAAAAIGALYLVYRTATKDAREFNKSVSETGDVMSDFITGVDTAKSALDGFDDSTIWTAEDQAKLRKEVDEAQSGITTITQSAVEERRRLTEEEFARLEELIDQLGAFADAEIEALEQKNRIAASMAAQEDNMTAEKAQEYLKAAEDNAAEITSIAYAQMLKEYQIADEIKQNAIQLREEKKIEEAKLEEERAAAIEDTAREEYDRVVEEENRKSADVMAIVQQRYMDQESEEMANIERIGELTDEKAAIIEEYNKKVDEINEEYGMYSMTAAQKRSEAFDEMTGEVKGKTEEIRGLWTDHTTEVAGTMGGLSALIESYGGDCGDAATDVNNAILDAFDELPDKTKESMRNAMQSAIDTVKGKVGDMYDSAVSAGASFLGGLKNVLGIHSPSKEMADIADNLIDSATDRLKQNRSKLSEEAGAMANDVLSEASRMADAQAMIAGMVQGSGLSAQIDAAGIANAGLSRSNSGSANSKSITVFGKIVHEGVNDKGEFVASVESAMDQLKEELRLEMMLAGG